DANAVFGEMRARELEVLRRLQQRFRRNAPHVHTGATEGGVHFDADRGETELRGANRGHVAAWAAADDDDVGRERISHCLTSEQEAPGGCSRAPGARSIDE